MKNDKIKIIIDELTKLYPKAKCELNYNCDYELLIAVVLSAQCTDKRVNQVTKVLFSKYDIFELSKLPLKSIEEIIYPCGTYTKKAQYLKSIATSLTTNYQGHVPNNRTYLESLPGVGHKTANVVLANLYQVPSIAVDTHVSRVAVRLGLASSSDNVKIIETKLMKKFPQDKWIWLHHALVLFGRYQCKAKNPECSNCNLASVCQYFKKKKLKSDNLN